MDDIIRRINEVSDIYEGLDEMLAEIDRKRTAYTRASLEKMRYLLTIDRSIKASCGRPLCSCCRPGKMGGNNG